MSVNFTLILTSLKTCEILKNESKVANSKCYELCALFTVFLGESFFFVH